MKRFAALVILALTAFGYLAGAEAQFNTTQPGCARNGFCSNSGLVAAPVSNACSVSSGTVITFTAQGTGGPNPNRVSVVSINWSDSTAAGTASLTGMTIGGSAMTKAVATTAGATNSNSEIWYLANPSGSNSNIVATFATAVNGVTIEVYSLIGYSFVSATSTGTTSAAAPYHNKQLSIAAASRTVNVSTSLSNMNNDFSSACGSGLWGVHASQRLNGNSGTLTTTINPTSNNPKIAVSVWSTVAVNCVASSSITGVIGWWDLSVPSSITASAGTANNLTSIADQSGLGNTMTFVPGITKPDYNAATGFNSSFPGFATNSSFTSALEAPSFPMGTGNTLTFWFVGTLTFNNPASNFGRVISYTKPGSTDDGNNAGSWTTHDPNSTTAQGFTRNSVTITKTGLTAAFAGHVIIGTINSSGVMTLYVDGAASSTSTSSGNWVTAGKAALGRRGGNAFDYGNNVYAEAGISTDFTNSTTVSSFTNCLKTKWGL